MTEQTTIDNPEVYQTPLEYLLTFLRVPDKKYREVYLTIVERYMSGKPYVIGFAANPYPGIAYKCHIEPDLAKEKVANLEMMKWMRIISVDNTNRVLKPIWRTKKGINELKFAEALYSYYADIQRDEMEQTSTEEIYRLMNTICVHTHKQRDEEVCSLGRWGECKRCKYRI